MKFSVEPWSADYATPFDGDAPGAASQTASIEEGVERDPGEWGPVDPSPGAAIRSPAKIMFVDGVQRIDAWVWIDAPGGARPGLCASYGAGVVCCDGKAVLGPFAIRRGLFSPVPAEPIKTARALYDARMVGGESTEHLRHAVGEAMAALETEVASSADPADLIVLDGPLRAGQHLTGAVGYVKTHHVRYLSDATHPVVAKLRPGQRTPLFVMATSWTRYSWYMRLPHGNGHDWAGIVRCEAPVALPVAQAVATADAVTASLPAFASLPHKDPRAPQNLYPIAGLERELRHRLGDPARLYRELRTAAAQIA